MTGVPIGNHLLTGDTVCCDPISWFNDAKLLHNPSAFVLGLPAFGKSTFVRRQLLGAAGMGITPLVLGDCKPDYRLMIERIGGQVIELGRGRGSRNVLDQGDLDAAAARLTGSVAAQLREMAHARRVNMVVALIELMRRTATTDTERSVMSAALKILAEHHPPDDPPLLVDLMAVLREPPEAVRAPTLDRGDDLIYRQHVDPLLRTLMAILDGPFGAVFAQPTTTPLRLDAPGICVDVSRVSGSDKDLEAAVLLATWDDGFGAVEAANALADAGLAPQRHFLVALDELWKVMRRGMVDAIDAVTRLNRAQGVGQIMITHTLADLRALTDESDRAKARGFVERAGMVVMAGLPAQELAEVTEIVRLSEAEKNMVTSWSTPPSFDTNDEPPGRGNFLIKIGGRAGIPVKVRLTDLELDARVHDTNTRWHQPPAIGESPDRDAIGDAATPEPFTVTFTDPHPPPPIAGEATPAIEAPKARRERKHRRRPSRAVPPADQQVPGQITVDEVIAAALEGTPTTSPPAPKTREEGTVTGLAAVLGLTGTDQSTHSPGRSAPVPAPHTSPCRGGAAPHSPAGLGKRARGPALALRDLIDLDGDEPEP